MDVCVYGWMYACACCILIRMLRWHWVYLVWGPSEGYFNYSAIENTNATDTLVEDSGHRRFLEETAETALYNDTHHRSYVFGENNFTDLNGTAIALCLPPIFTTMVVATIALLINVQVPSTFASSDSHFGCFVRAAPPFVLKMFGCDPVLPAR